MHHTVDTLLKLADEYATVAAHNQSAVTKVRDAIRTALTEALAQPTGCISNCDTCTYHHQSPAQAGYCYMFYAEPQGVCGQWKDTNQNISEYPEKDISAQPVRAPLTDDQIQAIYISEYNQGHHGRDLENLFARGIERAHNIGVGQ
jgi:hypothetical protein